MRRWFLIGCSVLFAAVVVSPLLGEDAPLPGAGADLSPLISSLSDPDPLVRRSAVAELIDLKDTARPALQAALVDAGPQTRGAINEILLHISWTRPADDPSVQQALAGYAERDADARCDVIESSLVPLGNAANNALLRIVLNDPSSAVRWEAADSLRFQVDNADAIARQVIAYADGTAIAKQQYLHGNENAPLLALAGWAQRQSNPQRGTDLISKAIALETDEPSAFRGQMDFAWQWLSDRAALQQDYARMVALLRRQAARTPWNADAVPEAVGRLFAAHAEHGPFPGLAEDLRCYQYYFGHPEMLYTLEKLLDRCHHPGVASVVDAYALLAGGNSADSHYATGEFLARRGWNAAAERELSWCISLSGGRAYQAYFVLSELADNRDDDLATAKYLEQGLRLMQEVSGQVLQGTFPGEYPAQVEWHYLRGYRLAKNSAAMKTHLEKLLDMDQNAQLLQKDPGMAADIVPALQELGRGEQADRVFDSAYAALMDKITTTPEDPMPKNNLAWLCACSGKKLEEAVKYSDQAVAMAPEDAACLDTQAESYFRTGRAREAVKIETRALQFKPGDEYMKRQIERFTAGTKTPPHEAQQ